MAIAQIEKIVLFLLEQQEIFLDLNKLLGWTLDAILGLGAVVGAISCNLADLQDRQGSYLSIYDQPALPI
ncbi:hypothetical protein LguiA_002537 [Lonicera macranthoides]